MEPSDVENEKRVAAEAAAALAVDGMTVGLGTGSTVAHVLPALAARGLDLQCVATSPRTDAAARACGLRIVPFDRIERLDLAIDGADQVDEAGWVVKGGGGAQLREKVVAAAAERFVVVISSDKLVERVGPPVPLELLAFGAAATLRRLGDGARLRDVPPSPDGGLIADLDAAVEDPVRLAAWLDAEPGVTAHGLFPPDLMHDVIVGRGATVEHRGAT